ncbi:hypothetical protein ACD591_17850 [Rufibacter glacialis]|uniref:Uncharacterized protein n=1 Tax=Rufibacter glacialis TaxID=1259555 RepID=A0A5M8Q6G7_9BACT|nr:hypothetical protein [Rufibacter glacialis]KAA6430708.1 hypothetical protein FOE74_19770 [Rufibacter glacialis]
MEESARKVKSNIFETALAVLVLFAIIFSIIDFIDTGSPNTRIGNPFAEYYSNPGIKRILTLKFISYCSFLVFFILLCFDKYRKKITVLITYLASALTIATLQWYELYYGSTFYYGEVRDKQGLGFPVLSTFMVTLIIWKINYSKSRDKDLTIKLILTGILNFGLYQFYGQVYESWNLSQS